MFQSIQAMRKYSQRISAFVCLSRSISVSNVFRWNWAVVMAILVEMIPVKMCQPLVLYNQHQLDMETSKTRR